MNRKPPSGEESSRAIRRRHELENRYDHLHGSILRTAWDIREDQYKRDLDVPAFPQVAESDAEAFIEYLDTAGTDWVDFGDSVRATLAYDEVDYSLRISRDSQSEFGVRAEWRYWEYST